MADINYEKYLIKDYTHWRIYLHTNQVYLGRCYVALKRDGNLDPFSGTTLAERDGLQTIIIDVQKALTKLFKPDMFNYANLRNIWHHCHWHIIPRYKAPRTFEGEQFSDKNWGKNYVPYDYKRVTPEAMLLKIKDKIQQALT